MTPYDTCLEKIQYAKDVGLQALDLSFMGLTTLPEEIIELKGLVELNLSNNSFTRLPFFIKELTSLKSLYLRDNCFSYTGGIGFDIVNDLQIEYIDLSLNNLSRIPEDIFYLSDLEEVELAGNPLMKGIPEIIIEQGIDAIHQFVEELYFSETTEKLLEAKLIFVGQGEVGKTSLMKKILNPHETIKVGYEPTTHGINVRRWSKEVHFSNDDLMYILKETIEEDDEPDEEDDNKSVNYWERINEYYEIEDDILEVHFNQEEDEYFNPLVDLFNTDTEKPNNDSVIRKQNFKTARFNIWDFGGQEIYYSTHQFFLTKRSIYIFVWDARKEEDYDRFLYWFNTINVLSEKSPIIVVMNKSDIREKSIEELSLRNTFPNIVNFHRISCVTGSGLKDLISSIDLAFKKLPHIGDRLPKDWLNIREDLNNLRENYITYERFIELCKLYGISKARANFLSNYLHDLGDILHFQNDETLFKIVILKPDWVTHAFYRLIDSSQIQLNNGKFFINQLVNVWDPEIHPKEKHIELIRLIESFELCFNILGTKEYILPELMPASATHIDTYVSNTNDTKFQYEFKFMPSGIMTRFICRNFLLIKYNSFWKNGVIVQYEDSTALIVSNLIEKKIDISINGEDREALLGVIRKEFNTIFHSLQLNLDEDYSEMVPCNCDICAKSRVPFFHPFSFLKKLYKRGVYETRCPVSIDNVSVPSLTKGFEKIKYGERILDSLLITCAQLQGMHKIQVSGKEDERNTIIATGLVNKGLVAKDQTRWGSSASGLSQGEIDIKIESDSGVTLGIFEGFNLSYLDTNKIHYHLEKVFNYDPNGLESNYVVVYVDSNDFINLWLKYQQVALTASYKYKPISDFQDVTSNYNSVRGSNIRIGRIAFRVNGDRNYVYHIFIKMKFDK